MLSFLRQVTTHGPPEDVFDYLSDFCTTNQWDPRANDTRRTSGDGGPGSRYSCQVSFAGRTVPMTYTVSALARPHRIEWVGTTDLVRATDVIHLVPEPDGATRVDYVASFEFARAPWLLDRVLEPALRRLCDDATVGLRSALPPSAA